MKTAITYVVISVSLAICAIAGFSLSRIERRIARAQQQISTFELQDPEATYADLSAYLDVTEAMPWFFRDTRADIKAQRAALRYWRGDYAALLRDYADPASLEAVENVPLQFIVANAAYRLGLDPDTEREQVVRSLDGAIDVYRGVLQGSSEHLAAAYNYEYLIRLRADIESGAEIQAVTPNQHGQEGEVPEDVGLEEIKVYVPVQRDVDPEIDESPTLGAGARIRKRG